MLPIQAKDIEEQRAPSSNKENKLTVLKPTDSIDRKEFDKMLKNIYVKQGYQSINTT
jgi:hypothetical protein